MRNGSQTLYPRWAFAAPFWRFCQEQKREQELQRVQKARFGANQAETVGHEVAKDIQHDAFSEREREPAVQP